MTITYIKSLQVANILGEGVLWDDIAQIIWWTNIEGIRFFSYNFLTGELLSYPLPERLCSFAMIEDSSLFLGAFETGLAQFDPKKQSIDWIEKIYTKGCGTRLNDGRVGPKGQFWVGAMLEDGGSDVKARIPANLFCFSRKRQLSIKETDIQISNSLSWSLDGSTLYFADSPKNTIYSYDVDPKTDDLTNKRVFAQTAKGVHPDGSCIDAQGFLWNAQWGAGQVVRYAPDGRIDLTLDIPCFQPTCVSFAGEELDYLVVTSARLGITPENKLEHPESGNVFIYKTTFKGLKEKRFRFDD